MHEIRSFKIFQTAKVMGVLFAVLFAISTTILTAFVFAVSRSHPETKMPPSIFFFFPIIAGVYFFIVTALVCWVYNLVAAQIGGIAFEVTPRSES